MNNKTKSILQRGKPERKVTDPVRFPKVINGFENIAKKMYAITLSKSQIEIGKVISKIAIENKKL